MFDLITGTIERPLRERAPTSTVVSIVLHVVVLTLVIGIPLLRVTNRMPDLPTIMAFAAAAAGASATATSSAGAGTGSRRGVQNRAQPSSP